MAGYYSNTSSSMLVTRPIRGSRRGRPRGSRRGGLTRASTTANTITVNLTNSDLGLETELNLFEFRLSRPTLGSSCRTTLDASYPAARGCDMKQSLWFSLIKEKRIPASLPISSSNYCSTALSGTLGYLDKWRLFESCVGLSYTARLID
uniref:(California timema) hypothetical protein n=1 Tax=Timema californicum TaxID=61474 RepID=A0A7R9JAZ0_TIMCA|nr:unnamed protein product [Timema californicum]